MSTFLYGTLVIVILLVVACCFRKRIWTMLSVGMSSGFGLSDYFPEKPVVVRSGTIVKRSEYSQRATIGSARLGIIPPFITFYSFQICCNDKHGSETIVVLVEQTDANSRLTAGCPVTVTSQQSRFDDGFKYRRVALAV